MRVKSLFFLIFLFVCDFSYCESTLPLTVQKSVDKIKKQLPLIRTTPEDLSGESIWELEHTIPQVENLLNHPLDAAVHLSSWNAEVLESSSASKLIQLSWDILGVNSSWSVVASSDSSQFLNPDFSIIPSPPPSPQWGEDKSTSSLDKGEGNKNAHNLWGGNEFDSEKSLPFPIKTSIRKIIKAIEKSYPLLKTSSMQLSTTERNTILTLHDFPVDEQFGEPPQTSSFKRKTYESMKKFDQNSLLLAAGILIKTIEDEISFLQEWKGEFPLINSTASTVSRRYKTDVGDVILSGKGNNHYTSEDLKNGVLLIDFGGKNNYECAVAGAKENEIKIVIDFGDNVTIVSTQDVISAGAGVFGIGLLFLPNSEGAKTIETVSFAQGAGLCGVGGLFVNGTGNFKGEKCIQGFSAFGVGIFSNSSGEKSFYEATRHAQGVGFTRGLGIFRHRGSDAVLRAGLVEPDPREPLGTTSLCQGVGFGFRGYAGGGIGLCVLSGDRLSLESSYFAQGAGYWHGAGSFFIEGNENRIKARRYDQGSGIHSAVGSFFLKGDKNHVMNWGVGPAFGWDNGLGWLLICGDGNKVQTEWGSVTASINGSRSFSVFSGNQNILDLPGLGTAQLTRDLPDYCVSVIEGEGNFLKHSRLKGTKKVKDDIFATPWGTVSLDGVQLTEKVDLPKVEWTSLPREEMVKKEMTNLEDEIRKVENLSEPQKIGRLLYVASAFSVDKIQPRKALLRIASVSDEGIPFIIQSLDPTNVEELIQIRCVVGVMGKSATQPVLDELKNEKGLRRASLLSLLAFSSVKDVVPILLQELESEDWRIRVTSVRILGLLFNNDRGRVPGRMHLLRSLEKWLSSYLTSKKSSENLQRQLCGRTFAESASILSLPVKWSIPERIAFLEHAPEDISANMGEENAKYFLSLLRAKKKEVLKNLRDEIASSELVVHTLREKLISILKTAKEESTPPVRKELIHAALIALGNIGCAEDVEIISQFLTHRSSLVREGASVALGRIGKGSLHFLEQAIQSRDAESRIRAILSVAAASDTSLLPILKKGVNDSDPMVEKISLSAIEQIQFPSEKPKQKLRKNAMKKYGKDVFHETEDQRIFLYGK